MDILFSLNIIKFYVKNNISSAPMKQDGCW